MKMVPGSLRSLALDALDTYIYEMSDHATVDICQRLGLYLSESIPHTLANEVTAKLLSCLNRKFHRKYLSEKLVEAVLLPTVTTLDFHPYYPYSRKLYKDDIDFDPYHPHSRKVYKDDLNHSEVVRIALSRLDKLPNLKMLRVGRKFYLCFFPSSLVEFTCKRSDFETLKSLSECCKLLRKLHMPNSNFYHHNFIRLILTFKHLEDLNLKNIDAEKTTGKLLPLVETLTRWMPAARVLQLKKFGCTIDSASSASEFKYLVQNFLELNHLLLVIYFESSDLSPYCNLLTNFKHLKSLHIGWCLKHVDLILDVVGSQLTQLNIKTGDPFDVCKLLEKCTSVHCLHIYSSCVFMPVPSAEAMRKLPPLKYLKCLSLKFVNRPDVTACLMFMCKNVELLKIKSFSKDKIIVRTILNEEPMKALKQLTWDSHSYPATREQILKIVEHCPNLEILRGNYVWSRHGNEVQKEKNCLFSCNSR